MTIRRVLMLMFSVIFAFVLAYLVYNFLNTFAVDDTQTQMEFVQILAANRDINESTIIREEDLKFVSIPVGNDSNKYYVEREELVGKFAAEKIYADEYIHSGRVIEKYNDKFARDINLNMRAVSIGVDQFTGVADLVKPGDRVDLYVFVPEKTEKEEINRPDIAKLLLQNIKVLSISQDRIGNTVPRQETPGRYAVTLEVHYKEVERIILAETVGYLKMALRPLGDDEINSTDGAIWNQLLDGSYIELEEDPGKKDLDASAEEVTNEESDAEEVVIADAEIYIVRSGDTLVKLAIRYYNDSSKYTLIQEANNIRDPGFIVTGSRLKIPKNE